MIVGQKNEIRRKDHVEGVETVPIPRSLAGYMKACGFPLDPTGVMQRLSGGLANQNYLLNLETGPMVLRKAPGGTLPPGAHDMAREHRVLSRLHEVFPLAPRSHLLCEDRAVLGAPFHLIDYRPGRVIRGADLSPLSPVEDLPRNLAAMLAETMARLHGLEPRSCGLEGLGRPSGFVPRAVQRWSNRARELTAGTDNQSLAAEIEHWLMATLGEWPDAEPAILHCDFKLDNLILAQDRLTPVAVIDWDMATLGDPLFDLATLLSYWAEPGDPECMHRLGQMPTTLPGFPDRQSMITAYESASGRSLAGLAEMSVLCLFKVSVVFLQLHARWLEGTLGDDSYADFHELGIALMEHTRSVARDIKR